jgi:hypothetical protein
MESFRDDVPMVVQLADAQLRAYNAKDTDAFCACFSDDVLVLGEDGEVSSRGIETFRERYAALFACPVVRGDIVGRVVVPPHLIEKELYIRQRSEDEEPVRGEVLVRYTERGGRIAVVQFWRP